MDLKKGWWTCRMVLGATGLHRPDGAVYNPKLGLKAAHTTSSPPLSPGMDQFRLSKSQLWERFIFHG